MAVSQVTGSLFTGKLLLMKHSFRPVFVRSAEASGLSAVSRLRLSLWNWQTQRPVFLSRDYQQFLTQEAQECFTSAPRDKKHRRFIAVTVNSGYEPAYLTSALPGSFPECHSSNSSIHPESPPAKSEALPSHAQDDEDNDLFGKPFGDHDRDVLMKLQTEIQEIKRNQQEQLNRSEQPCATCTTRSAQQKTSKVPKHDWLQRLHAHLQDNLGIDLSNLDLGRPSPPMSSSSAALPVRHAASCDVCSGPIIGTRIRCMECPDWDCCSDCEPSLGQLHPHHKFIPIYENNGPWQPQNLVRHRGITCDGCKEFIAGPRFKCIVCPDYDLCMRCEALPSAYRSNVFYSACSFPT